jgi:hypothetical protein
VRQQKQALLPGMLILLAMLQMVTLLYRRILSGQKHRHLYWLIKLVDYLEEIL